MRLCLAGTFPAEKVVRENRPEYVLESFFYIKPWQVEEMSIFYKTSICY